MQSDDHSKESLSGDQKTVNHSENETPVAGRSRSFLEGSVEGAFKNQQPETIEPSALLAAGHAAFERLQFGVAVQHYEQARLVLEEMGLKDNSLLQDCLQKLSECYTFLDKPQEALEIIQALRRVDERNQLAMWLRKASTLRSQGKYAEAVKIYKEGLEVGGLSLSLGDPLMIQFNQGYAESQNCISAPLAPTHSSGFVSGTAQKDETENPIEVHGSQTTKLSCKERPANTPRPIGAQSSGDKLTRTLLEGPILTPELLAEGTLTQPEMAPFDPARNINPAGKISAVQAVNAPAANFGAAQVLNTPEDRSRPQSPRSRSDNLGPKGANRSSTRDLHTQTLLEGPILTPDLLEERPLTEPISVLDLGMLSGLVETVNKSELSTPAGPLSAGSLAAKPPTPSGDQEGSSQRATEEADGALINSKGHVIPRAENFSQIQKREKSDQKRVKRTLSLPTFFKSVEDLLVPSVRKESPGTASPGLTNTSSLPSSPAKGEDAASPRADLWPQTENLWPVADVKVENLIREKHGSQMRRPSDEGQAKSAGREDVQSKDKRAAVVPVKPPLFDNDSLTGTSLGLGLDSLTADEDVQAAPKADKKKRLARTLSLPAIFIAETLGSAADNLHAVAEQLNEPPRSGGKKKMGVAKTLSLPALFASAAETLNSAAENLSIVAQDFGGLPKRERVRRIYRPAPGSLTRPTDEAKLEGSDLELEAKNVVERMLLRLRRIVVGRGSPNPEQLIGGEKVEQPVLQRLLHSPWLMLGLTTIFLVCTAQVIMVFQSERSLSLKKVSMPKDVSGMQFESCDQKTTVKCLAHDRCLIQKSGVVVNGKYSRLSEWPNLSTLFWGYLSRRELWYRCDTVGLIDQDNVVLYRLSSPELAVVKRMWWYANFAQEQYSESRLYPSDAEKCRRSDPTFQYVNPAIVLRKQGDELNLTSRASGDRHWRPGAIFCLCLGYKKFSIQGFDRYGRPLTSSDPSRLFTIECQNGLNLTKSDQSQIQPRLSQSKTPVRVFLYESPELEAYVQWVRRFCQILLWFSFGTAILWCYISHKTRAHRKVRLGSILSIIASLCLLIALYVCAFQSG
jgi:hypothetical protein